MTDPNLESQDEARNLDDTGPQHIDVAPPAAFEDAAPPPPPPAGPAPVRTFPQHYKLLFGTVIVLFSTLTIWERAHVFGADVHGAQMISGVLLMAMAAYGVLVSAMNIMQGRLAGMLAMFMTGVLALYFGIPKLVQTEGMDGFLGKNEIEEYVQSKDDPAPKIPTRFQENAELTFPSKTLDKFTTANQVVYYWIGQFAPGPLLSTFGGVLLIWVFLSAMFGGKKKEPEKAPAPAGRRRRR